MSKTACEKLALSDLKQKSRIRETLTLSTDADSRTDKNLKRLCDSSIKKNCSQKHLGGVQNFFGGVGNFFFSSFFLPPPPPPHSEPAGPNEGKNGFC